MYKMTKDEIEMYVTTIHNAYPAAPEAAMEDMRERFGNLELADNFFLEAHKKMDMLNTAILINHLSRRHVTNEIALAVIALFDDERIMRQIHAEYPDEQMEERIRLVSDLEHNIREFIVRTTCNRHAIRSHKRIYSLKQPSLVRRTLHPSIP